MCIGNNKALIHSVLQSCTVHVFLINCNNFQSHMHYLLMLLQTVFVLNTINFKLLCQDLCSWHKCMCQELSTWVQGWGKDTLSTEQLLVQDIWWQHHAVEMFFLKQGEQVFHTINRILGNDNRNPLRDSLTSP